MAQGKNQFREEYLAKRHEEYLRAKAEGKKWANTLERWFSLPYEERSARQKIQNAKHRIKYPNESAESMRKWREIHGKEERMNAQEYRRNNKKLAIEYLGGKCLKCGGTFHPDVYDFHHKNGDEKDICVARLLMKKFEVIKIELNKCVLLCANCHRIEHAEY